MAVRKRPRKSSNDWSKYGLTIDPDELRRRLRINKDALDKEIEEQPELYGQVAEAAAMARSHVERLKEDIKTREAELDKEIREEAEDEEERTTESQIRARISSHKDRKALVAEQLDAEDAQRRLDALASAIKSRSYALRDCVDLFLADYYSSHSARGSSSRRKEAEVEKNVKRMQERRQGRVKKGRSRLPRAR